MEGLVKGADPDFWNGRRVIVTGHTGFMGSWLCLYLSQLGAKVSGLALAPPTDPNLYTDAGVADTLEGSVEVDIADLDAVRSAFTRWQPEIVFHLAAQPLVRESYDDPVLTYQTNVLGTVHVLQACRDLNVLRAVVNVTTDKCYENQEWLWGYREFDRLGGRDPYSNSKACSELVTEAYRASFFPPVQHEQHGVAIASARAGNCLGGGDWATNRLVPDAARAWINKQVVRIRFPDAVRPWQHVLEPIRGYLMLAERLVADGPAFSESWNFGPQSEDVQTVRNILEQMASVWPDSAKWEQDGDEHPHEATFLTLDCSKARSRLNWKPALDLDDCLDMIAKWYALHAQSGDVGALTKQQIADYVAMTPPQAEGK